MPRPYFSKKQVIKMTFKELAKDIKYKTYSEDKTTISRRFNLERDVAEELNKIIQVLHHKANIIVGSSVIGDIAMRYFFQMLEEMDEDDAMELLVNGILLKI